MNSKSGCAGSIVSTILIILAIVGLLLFGFTVAPLEQLDRQDRIERGR
jgi:hypothetical protein